MNLLSRIVGLLGLKSVGSADVLRMLTAATASKSGARVSHATALTVSTVMACARAVAQDLAQCPWEVREKLGDGDSREAIDNPVASLLDVAPNEWQTAYEFREQITLHAFLAGNAFSFKNVVQGVVRELLPFDPGSVTVSRARDGWTPVYRVRWPDGETSDLPPASVWHVRGPSWDGLIGLDAVKLARESIGLAMATEEHGARVYGNGGRPSGILTHDLQLPSDKVAEIRDRWESAYGGENAGKVAVLHGGMKWQPIAMNFVDAQNIETRRHQVEEICRALGVFPARIGHADKASTYASVEQFFLAHATLTLAPWARRLDTSARKHLLENSSRFYAKHNLNALMRGAAKDRAEFYTAMITNGSMTRNEVRAKEDLNRITGLDVPLVQLNMGDGTKPPAADNPKDPPPSGPDGNNGPVKASPVTLNLSVDARAKTVTKRGNVTKDPVTGVAHFEITETMIEEPKA